MSTASLGKAEVVSSILTGSTIFPVPRGTGPYMSVSMTPPSTRSAAPVVADAWGEAA